MLGHAPARRRRLYAATSIAGAAVLALAGCSSGSSSSASSPATTAPAAAGSSSAPAAGGSSTAAGGSSTTAGGSSTTAASSTGGGSSAPAVSNVSGKVNWWGWTPDANVASTYIKAFNQQYPNIKVTYKMLTIAGYNAALRPALASSVGPDVFDVAPGAANGPIDTYGVDAIDLTPAVEKALGSDWKSKLAPIGVSSLTVGGKLRALSVGAVFAGTVWINQDLFTKYNLKAPTTLAEWVNVCSTFKSHGVGCFVQGAAQTAFDEDTIQAISDNIEPGKWVQAIAGTAKWTDPTIVKALTIWQSLFHNGIMESGALGVQQYPDANNAFLSQKDAMVMMGTWYMQYSTKTGMTAAISGAGVKTPTPFTQLAIPFPDVAGTGHSGSVYGDADFGLAVNARSKNIPAATAFATWLGTSQAGQQLVANVLNDIPALVSAQPIWAQTGLVNPTVQQPALAALIAKTGQSSEPRLSTVSADLQTAIGVAATTTAAGSASPDKAAATLQSAADKLK
jgi:raffinose/stachyose/melibiose transport system substrate-binding protein